MVCNTFEGFDYDPNTVEDEMFLSQAPLSLLEENIRSQFQEPGENRKNDFIQIFLNKYIYSKTIELEDEEEDIEEMHDDFVSFMEDLLKEYLDIGLPEIDDANNESQEELVHYIYRFFIINIKRNFVNLLVNYINKNRDMLISDIPKKKDVGYLTYKKFITDDNDLELISNLSTVIYKVFSMDLTVSDFLEYAKSDSSNLEIDFVSSCYNKGLINGNFVNKYIEMILNDVSLSIEIECKVKNKILKKICNSLE